MQNALGEISSQLDTRTKGRAIAVYNPVARDREEVCTAELDFPVPPDHLEVFDGKGKEIPCQVIERKGTKIKFIFNARTPSMGVSIYDVRESVERSKMVAPSLFIEPNTLENDYYRVTIDENGDISSILDKTEHREILSKPASLEFQHEIPSKEPAWNMFWYDRKNPPFAFLNQQPEIRIAENGPVRIAFEVKRKGQNSVIRQTISLAAVNSFCILVRLL